MRYVPQTACDVLVGKLVFARLGLLFCFLAFLHFSSNQQAVCTFDQPSVLFAADVKRTFAGSSLCVSDLAGHNLIPWTNR